MINTLDCQFAILDVKGGRHDLAAKIEAGDHQLVAVFGKITSVNSDDDGVSIEFGSDVKEAVIADDVMEFMVNRGIKAAIEMAYGTSVDCGWYHDPATGQPIKHNFGERIALIHSELSEALEADRKDLMDDKLPHRKGVEVELADAVIRIFDLAGAEGYDLAGAIIEKNKFNRSRHDHTAEGRKAANGKKY